MKTADSSGALNEWFLDWDYYNLIHICLLEMKSNLMESDTTSLLMIGHKTHILFINFPICNQVKSTLYQLL